MVRKYRRLALLPILGGIIPGCNDARSPTQMTYDRMDEVMQNSQPHLIYMADNAMMHDMSIADFHFIPHSTELSGTGVARLDRMALVLSTYGGTLRYETYLADTDFVKQRLAHVREYLETIECDMDHVLVKAMISGGRGMPAEQAIVINEKGTTPSPQGGGQADPSQLFGGP